MMFNVGNAAINIYQLTNLQNDWGGLKQMLKYRPKSHENGHDLGMASGNTTENTLVMS